MRIRLALAAAAVFAAAPVHAATYQVSPSGNDTANGTSAPFKTFQKAVSVLRDGDTVVLQAGTYTAGALVNKKNVTIRGEGAVVLDGAASTRIDGVTIDQTTDITLENLKIQNCKRMGVFCVLSQRVAMRNCELVANAGSGILTGHAHDVLVENCYSHDNIGHGIYLSESGDRLTVRGNRLFGNHRAGLQINAHQDSPNANDPSNDSLSKEVVVENNVITGNGTLGGAAINLMGVQNGLLVNNLIYNNLAGGIALWDDGAGAAYGCKNNRLWHNTVVFPNGKGRYGVQVLDGSTGNQIINNIIICGVGSALEIEEPVQSNHNCLSAPTLVNGGTLAAWRSSTGNDQNSAQGDPKLTAAYHLAADSPARDTAAAVYDRDMDGRLRPQGANPDIGCFEEGTDDTVAVTPPTGLTAVPGDGRVDLLWTAVVQPAARGYYLYRSNTQNGSYTRSNAGLISGTAFADLSVANGSTYWYRVTTVDAGGAESAPSALVSATPAAAVFSVRGKVTVAGSGLAGAQVSAGDTAATTGTDGSYTLSGLPAGAYEVTATKSGYTFSSPVVVNLSANRDGVDFTGQATPPPAGSADVVYADSLRAGWTSKSTRAQYSLNSVSPVAQGSSAVSLTVKGKDGSLLLSGAGITVNGKSAVKLLVHGGAKGGQALRLRALVDGKQSKVSINLQNYGGLPRAGQWTEYSVPLADLQAGSGSLTGVKIFAGKKQAQAFLDNIRVE